MLLSQSRTQFVSNLTSECVHFSCSSSASNQKDAFVAYSRLAELSHDRKDFERAERLYLQSLDVLMSPSDLSNTYQIWLKSMNGKKSADFGEPIKYIDSNLRKKLLEHGRNIAGVLNNLSVLYSEQSKEESAQGTESKPLANMMLMRDFSYS